MSTAAASSTPWSVHTVTYGHAGSLPLLADVYTATATASTTEAAASSAPKPVYLFFHGGCLIFGDRRSFPPTYLLRELVAQRGWTLISFDYRLLPESTLEDINADLLTVERFACNQLNPILASLHLPPVDITRAVVGGASAGGYLALQAGHLFTQLRPRAVAAMYPMTLTRVDWYGQPHPDARPQAAFLPADIDVQAVERLVTDRGQPLSGFPLGDWKQPRFALYRVLINSGRYWQLALGSNDTPGVLPPTKQRLLPALNIDTHYPPTLLAHGTADSTVPIAESDDVAAALKAAGVEHVFLRVEGREHGLDAVPTGDDVAAARKALVEFALSHAQ